MAALAPGRLQELLDRIDALPTGPTGPGAPVTWFLDIDGVLNVIGPKPATGWPSYLRTGVGTSEGFMWPVVYAPALVVLLNRLHERGVVSFRWLTTWEYDAPSRFAPALGLKLGQWVAAEDTGASKVWWKLAAIIEHLQLSNELFIWTDDDIKHDLKARQTVDFLPAERAVVLCPDERRGLSPEDFEVILAAIEVRAGRSTH